MLSYAGELRVVNAKVAEDAKKNIKYCVFATVALNAHWPFWRGEGYF